MVVFSQGFMGSEFNLVGKCCCFGGAGAVFVVQLMSMVLGGF